MPEEKNNPALGKPGDRWPGKPAPVVKTFAEVLREAAAGGPGRPGNLGPGRPNIFIGTLNIFAAPSRYLTSPLARHYGERYESKFRFAKTFFAIDLALLAAALVLLVADLALFVYPGKVRVPFAAEIAIEPKNPRNGEIVSLFITAKNYGGELLEPRLSLHLPETFRLIDFPSAYDSAANSLALGTMPAGASRKVAFRVLALAPADEGTETRANVIVSLSGSTRGQLAERTGAKEIIFDGSVFSVNASLPPQVLLGDEFELPVSFKNGAAVPLGPLKLSVCPSGALTLASGSEKCIEATRSLLGTGESISAPAYLAVAGDYGETAVKLAVLLGEGEETAPIFGQTLRTMVVDSGATVTLAIPGAIAPTAQKGTLPLLVGLKRLSVGLKAENAKIIWAPESGEEKILASLTSEELADFIQKRVWRTALALPLPVNENGARLFAEMSVVRSDGERLKVHSVPIRLPATLKVEFQATARYWSEEGEQLGRGPLPPRVGQKTEYWIFWNLAPIKEDLEAVTVSAKLPAGVSWTGKETSGVPGAGPVIYNSFNRTIRWSVGNIPRAAAEQGISAAFAVLALPGSDERGKEMTLVGPATVQLKTVSGAEASASAPSATTALPLDARAKGRGIVQ
ncbi:hypothetical protein EPN90_03440 [Patescibacteria group bacterium]|nr:MAG: hypothetical protein EPN90_03440 [Patescibacteria group bacterium]